MASPIYLSTKPPHVGHRREIFVHGGHQLGRRDLLGDRGEVGDVGEIDGDVAHLAAEHGRLVGRQHPLDDRRRKVEREAVAQQPLAVIRDHEAVADGRAQRRKADDDRLDERQRQRLPERARMLRPKPTAARCPGDGSSGRS